MKITPLEIKSHIYKKGFFGGYDKRDVEAQRDLAAEALETAKREISLLEEKLRDAGDRLAVHLRNENLLKEAITSTQRMVEEIKGSARKEAELIVAEARIKADEVVKLAHDRALKLQEEIMRLKKQRAEIESAIKAVIDYHSTKLLIEEEDFQKAEEEAERLRILRK